MADRYSIIKKGPVLKDPKKVEQEEKEYALLLKFLEKSSGIKALQKVIETLDRLYKNQDISYSNYTEFQEKAKEKIRTRTTAQRTVVDEDADFFNSLGMNDEPIQTGMTPRRSRRSLNVSSGGSCSGARNGGC